LSLSLDCLKIFLMSVFDDWVLACGNWIYKRKILVLCGVNSGCDISDFYYLL
jgi:hypothetical protein